MNLTGWSKTPTAAVSQAQQRKVLPLMKNEWRLFVCVCVCPTRNNGSAAFAVDIKPSSTLPTAALCCKHVVHKYHFDAASS